MFLNECTHYSKLASKVNTFLSFLCVRASVSLHSGRGKVAPVKGVVRLQNKNLGMSSKFFNITVFLVRVKLLVARWQSPKKALICLDLELIK